MGKKQKVQHRRFPAMPFFALGFLAVVASFTVGMKTAGDVSTVSPLEASGTRISGDINSDSLVDERDAIVILEIAQGYEEATPEQLLADPNHDGKLTIDDAIRI